MLMYGVLLGCAFFTILLIIMSMLCCRKKINKVESVFKIQTESVINLLCVKYISGLVEILKVNELCNRITINPSDYNILFTKEQLSNTIDLGITYEHYVEYMHRNPTDYNIDYVIEIAKLNNRIMLVKRLHQLDNTNKLLIDMISSGCDIITYHKLYSKQITFNVHVEVLELAVKTINNLAINHLISYNQQLCKFIKKD